MKQKQKEWVGPMALWVCLFVAGGAIAFSDDDVQEPRQLLSVGDSGEEYVGVFVGGTKCGWSNHDSVPYFIRAIFDSIEVAAKGSDYGFRRVGIAVGWSVMEGIDYLQWVEEFDEVSTGSNWLNQGIEKYVRANFGGRVVTPQIILIKREIGSRAGENGYFGRQISREVTVGRLVGLDVIRRAVGKGPEAFSRTNRGESGN